MILSSFLKTEWSTNPDYEWQILVRKIEIKDGKRWGKNKTTEGKKEKERKKERKKINEFELSLNPQRDF